MGLFKTKFNIDDEMLLLREELATIEETKVIVQGDWWKKTSEMLKAKTTTYEREIMKLSANPRKYEKEIVFKRAIVIAIEGLISGIEATVYSEEDKKKKLTKLQEIASVASLVGDNLLGNEDS